MAYRYSAVVVRTARHRLRLKASVFEVLKRAVWANVRERCTLLGSWQARHDVDPRAWAPRFLQWWRRVVSLEWRCDEALSRLLWRPPEAEAALARLLAASRRQLAEASA